MFTPICRYIVIKPYGEHLELSRHGLKVVLLALVDVANTMKLANTHGILHRDIKPANIVLYNDRGYLIDWGIATIGNSAMNKLSATLVFCSLKVYPFYYRYRLHRFLSFQT